MTTEIELRRDGFAVLVTTPDDALGDGERMAMMMRIAGGALTRACGEKECAEAGHQWAEVGSSAERCGRCKCFRLTATA